MVICTISRSFEIDLIEGHKHRMEVMSVDTGRGAEPLEPIFHGDRGKGLSPERDTFYRKQYRNILVQTLWWWIVCLCGHHFIRLVINQMWLLILLVVS